MCHTNDDGPSPNSQCAFPFREPPEREGETGKVTYACSYGPNPSDADQVCRQVKTISICLTHISVATIPFTQFRKQYPGLLVNSKTEVVIYGGQGKTSNKSNSFRPVKTCYAPHAGLKGWCATCKIAGAADDANLCTDDVLEPSRPGADSNWYGVQTLDITVVQY